MKSLAAIEARLDELIGAGPAAVDAGELLALGETVLEHWVRARGVEPTADRHEGFRLLALQRQGAHGLPSFNACRESCRELVFHYNLLTLPDLQADRASAARMMVLLANHVCLFVAGKMQTEGLGEFCCASRPLRADAG